ncbi:stage III sporulation protein AC/AD protein family protein [Ruminiclostridium hungatei]|uniref:Stage III sporulation protein AC/AD protein family protein n=1 Tax=Ruminiclostridium hungatei TaxID=48256 RepID=A0A1V4SIW2_RUMHU|nr:stage III sporulation protein AD [Ruminiclostridium hungatei]OPX43446.1 stage III sporulation protein AC/AD protein family protein [Ruminiclostridium hungatei]
MDILQIVCIGIVAVVLSVTIKQQKPEIALQVSIATGLLIFILIVVKLTSVIEFIKTFSRKADIDAAYIGILLKIVGIAYIAEFGAEVCKDAGESSIASKIELAGKVTIVILAVPIISSLLDLVVKLMP